MIDDKTSRWAAARWLGMSQEDFERYEQSLGDSLTPTERRAFDDRAAERECYKAIALSRAPVFKIRSGVPWTLDEPIWPGKILLSNEQQLDLIYARP